MDSADPPFPRAAGYWWFGCRSETKGSVAGKDLHSSSSVDLYSELKDEAHNRQYSDSDVDDLILDAGEAQPQFTVDGLKASMSLQLNNITLLKQLIH